MENTESSSMGKIGKYYDENGFIKTILRIAEKLLHLLISINKYYVMEKYLSGDIPYIKAGDHVTFKMAELKDIDYFKDILKPWHLWSKITLKRFKDGQTCILCLHENRAVGYYWACFMEEKDSKIGLTVRPKDNESYGLDLFVLPEYRKYKIGYELISRFLEYSKAAGKEKAFCVVAEWNKPMLRCSSAVFGFNVTKEMRSVEFFKKRGFIISSRRIGPHS